MAESIADVDQWGIDPLTVQAFDDVDQSSFEQFRVNAALEGNPQLISFNKYGTNAYWNYILIANGMVHASEIKAGMTILLPIRRPKAAVKKLTQVTI
ncbi:hypothetical protein YOLOSWAG_125 [Erwinia phage vB_EamM_Yoloswag]|uniref:Uncharacterized protein n=1 Tax=Erwinia phage vB_EamM_Yoloswag TaxID=1958956 RepID=A0A1S6L357_9CAUD|nr:tail sheath [Erwinia phage vB_EamM_Yoloswag]AQT28606.1 hypothetical protein YOLOSWAG_125 [Erwinia phage vB_EamM_Yoloswag]